MNTVSPERGAFEARYCQALTAYVDQGAEELELMGALELGRKALAEGYGLLDLLALHQASLSPLLQDLSPGTDIERSLARATEFLTQVAAPFEMAYRGWRETAARLRQANDELEARVAQRTAAYREAEERLDRAQQIAGVGSWELDLRTGDQIWSKELYRICGLPVGSHLSASYDVFAFVDEADRQRHSEWVARLEAGRDPGPIEYRIRRPSGEHCVVRAEGDALVSADGTINKVSGTLQDITEKKAADLQIHELQAELAHVSRLSAMGQMAAMVVHELNQPLTAIGNYMSAARTLLDRGGDLSMPRLRIAVDRTGDQVARAVQIMRRLRGFSSRGDGKTRSEPLSPLVKETIELLLVGTKTEGISIKVSADLPDISVIADKIEIQQVLLNLLRNAIEAVAGQERREVCLLIESRGDAIQISIIDNGPGLPDEVRAKLFRPFVSTKKTGMGVGLAICHTIISAHNGRLWAEENPTGGTIFRLMLPVATAGERIDTSS
jgi:two-component system, LuxR family, sensor kinase FixL